MMTGARRQVYALRQPTRMLHTEQKRTRRRENMMDRRTAKKLTMVMLCGALIFGLSWMAVASEKEKKPAQAEAKPIAADAAISETHPKMEEGVSCNDCHEVKLDAKTTATEAWLERDYLKWKKGEGTMPRDKVWERVVKIFADKGGKRTMVLGTSFNNRPTTTTAEFALDTKKQILYGLDEKGTAKLVHIKTNPYVCLNWHREFDDNFANTLCIQVTGKAEILTGDQKAFDEALTIYPYAYGATARKMSIDTWRGIIKKEMVMTKITIDKVVMVDGSLARSEYRTSQQWKRK